MCVHLYHRGQIESLIKSGIRGHKLQMIVISSGREVSAMIRILNAVNSGWLRKDELPTNKKEAESFKSLIPSLPE